MTRIDKILFHVKMKIHFILYLAVKLMYIKNQGHSIERTTHSMEIAHEILTMYYAHFTCPLSRSSRYCRHFEIK